MKLKEASEMLDIEYAWKQSSLRRNQKNSVALMEPIHKVTLSKWVVVVVVVTSYFVSTSSSCKFEIFL